MRFYFNADINLCMNEYSLIQELLTYPAYEDWTYLEVQQELHSMRELEGWYECEVCDEIRKLFEEKEKSNV